MREWYCTSAKECAIANREIKMENGAIVAPLQGVEAVFHNQGGVYSDFSSPRRRLAW